MGYWAYPKLAFDTKSSIVSKQLSSVQTPAYSDTIDCFVLKTDFESTLVFSVFSQVFPKIFLDPTRDSDNFISKRLFGLIKLQSSNVCPEAPRYRSLKA